MTFVLIEGDVHALEKKNIDVKKKHTTYSIGNSINAIYCLDIDGSFCQVPLFFIQLRIIS